MKTAAKCLAALALAACSLQASAQACETLAIDVLPLTLAVDDSASYAQLTAMAQGRPTFALTKVKYSGTLTGCQLTVGYANPTIYIASEFAGNACTRNELLAHELRHVQAYAMALATLAERVRAATLTRPLADAISDALEAVEPQQHEIDTQAEYRRLMQACGSAVARTTGLKP